MITDIPDESRLVVIDSIRTLCLQYPRKSSLFLSFLSQLVREEGSITFKRAIIDTLIELLHNIEGTRETGSSRYSSTRCALSLSLISSYTVIAISHLCEFIEDCEFPVLCQRVLHLLGREIPTIANPARCIRFLYNRFCSPMTRFHILIAPPRSVVLESPSVRAAAVCALTRVAAACPDLRKSLVTLLKKFLI